MFEIKDDLADLRVKERNIFKILYSMNSHPVATPGMNVEEARCYILFFSEGPNLSAFIGLYLPRTDRKLFYAYSSNPFPVEGEADVEDEARAFAEDMGFLLDEINIAGMAAEDRAQWIEEQFIFGYRKPEEQEESSEKAEAAPAEEEKEPEETEEGREPEATDETAPAPLSEAVQPAPEPEPAPAPASAPVISAASIWPEPASESFVSTPPPAPPAPQTAPPRPAQSQRAPQPEPRPSAKHAQPSVRPQEHPQPVPKHLGQPSQEVSPLLQHPVPELGEPIVPQAQPGPVERKPQSARAPATPAPKNRQPTAKPAKPAARGRETYEEAVPVEVEIEQTVSRQNVLETAYREQAAKRANQKPAGRAGAVTRDKEALARLLASF